MTSRIIQVAARSVLALALLAASTGAAHADSATTTRMTVNGIDVTVDGGKSRSVGSLADGVAIQIDQFAIRVEGQTMKIGEAALQMPADVRSIRVEAKGFALDVLVNGESFHKVTEGEGALIAGAEGSAEDLNALGIRYLRGDGVERDPAMAMKFYRMAAEKGLAVSQSNLAFMYWEGEHVPRNVAEAVRWAEMAAKGDNLPAMWLLGRAYSDDEGVAPNLPEAVRWMTMAAEKNHAPAMNDLAVMYGTGNGVPQDNSKAAEWYERAMFRGSVVAASNLAGLFRDGDGVPKDLNRAEELFEAALNSGHASAAEDLADVRKQLGKAPGLTMTGSEQQIYWFSENELAVGPMTASFLRLAIREGRVKRDTMVWTAPSQKWQPAKRIPDVVALF